MAKNTESKIQKELILWLKKEYPEIEYNYNKNEGVKNTITAVNDKRMGLIAGKPDLTIFYNHKNITYILEWELKTKKGSLNKNQKLWWKNFTPTENRKGTVSYGYNQAKEHFILWLHEINA